MRPFFLLFVFILLTGATLAEGPEKADKNPVELDAALERGISTPGSPFHLQVNCTDKKGIRSLELFPGGVTVWNKQGQIMLPEKVRSTLLSTLLEQGFSEFEPHYGGREQPAKSAAPARISCRVHIDIESLQKNSVQQVGGEQLTPVTKLAAILLDQVEAFSHGAVTPVDLRDALDKLSTGKLSGEVLRLRFVDIPASGSDTPGSILRIQGGNISRQAYSPGRVIAEQIWNPLENGQYLELISALQAAQPANLPGNLWSDDQLEFEIHILAHKKVVLARPFARLDAATLTPAQQQFNKLLSVLRQLGQ